MKRYVVITTYPAHGSRNIGDYLITQSLIEMIKAAARDQARIDVIWRGSSWEEVSELALKADHIFFACLAIRADMGSKVYPYARNIVNSDISYSVLAAGTDLPVKDNVLLGELFDDETIELLRDLGARATVFTTRGLLTQAFCRRIGIDSSDYQGDIAFYSPSRYGSRFRNNTAIRSIVISDPHRPEKYQRSLSVLVDGLRTEFPSASLVVVLHGVNDVVRTYCLANGVDTLKIYEDPANGLSVYEDCDLHVGYRVHGHVSALKNRTPSYLLEQDGRGADYGVSLSRKISVPHFLQHFPGSGDEKLPLQASISAPQQILSMIFQDAIDGFQRFWGFEAEVEAISRRAEQTIQTIVGTL